MIRKTIIFTFLLFSFSHFSFSQTVTATQTDSLVGDHQTIGIANPNDTVRYKTTISVTGATATGVNFNNPIPTNTTQIGTVKTSALCRDEVFATSFNTLLNTGNVLSNDYGIPSVSVVSFGTTMSGGTTTLAGNVGTTNGGGSLTVNANGTFSYQPMSGFFGMDQFTYIASTGVVGLQNGSGTVTINVAEDITFEIDSVDILCNGASTGSITFMASGGTGALTYSITGAMGSYQMMPTFSGLTAGTYNLAVKDAVGYIKTSTTTLTESTLITFSTMDVHNVCNGGMTGSITFSANDGTSPYMYSITGAMGTYQMSNVFSALAANTYNLAVKDANNCIVTGSTTITEPTAVTFTFTKTDITCNGAGNGSIVFNTTSGGTSPYSYSINGPSPMSNFTVTTSYTGLSANTYNLIVKDNLDCNSTVVPTTVIEPAAIVVSGTISNLTYNVAMSNAPFTKTGGSGSPATPWSASGLPTGVNINTTTGIVNGTPTQTGMFTATITYTDANGCTDDIMVSFNVAPRLLNESYAVVGNTQLVSNGHSTPTTPHTTNATNILTNDQSDAAITVTAGTFPTHFGGAITIGTDGKFIYSPDDGDVLVDTFTYTGTSNGVSATAKILLNISNMVWYVNNTFGGTPDGRSHAPFTTGNAAAAAANLANDIIYVHTGSGNTTGNIPLDASQTLRGAGSALTVGALSLAAGTKPTLTGIVTLANSVAVDGFDMSTGSGTALTSTGATSVVVSIGNVTTSGAANAVSLTNTTGAVVIAGGTITGGAGAPINISGGSVSFTDAGSVSQSTASQPLVSISGGHTGTVTFNTGTLSATNGTGLQFDNADGTYNIFGTCTLNGGDAGVDIINGSSGSFAFTTTNITNPSGIGFNVNSSTPTNISCNGSISKNNAGRLIDITSNSGGTMVFNNTLSSTGTSSGILVNSNSGVTMSFASATKTLNTGANSAVTFTSNAGTIANFSGGGLDIDVTSATGFNATGGGTINVSGTGNTITSTTGTALNFANTTIGSSNLNFQSISANGGTNGIVLNTTGSSGGLTVTGTGVANSGGAIQNTSGDGINLSSASNISLTDMIINTCGGSWIETNNVTNLTLIRMNADLSTDHGLLGSSLTNLTIQGGTFNRGAAGNALANFNGVHITNLLGNSSVTGATFSNSNTVQFRVNNNAATNFSGTPDILTVSNNAWNTHTGPFSGDHLSVSADNGGNFRLIVNNTGGANIFKTGGIGVQAAGAGSGKMDALISGIISGGTIASGDANTAGVAVAGTASSTVTFNVNNNTTLGTGSLGMTINDFTSGTFSGSVSNNNITHIAGPGTDALQIISHGDQPGSDGTAMVTVSNNTIIGNFQRGIRSHSAFGDGTLNITISGNTVHGTEPTATALRAIEVEVGGSGGGTTNTILLNLLNNNAWMDNGNAGYRLFHRAGYTFSLKDLTGSGTDPVNIANWIDNVKANNSNGGPATTLITGVANNFTSF